jgi:predicted small lipoprotein YifL
VRLRLCEPAARAATARQPAWPALVNCTPAPRGGAPFDRNQTMTRCILCLAALLLAACGQSGALYLPDQAPPKPSLVKKDPRKDDSNQPAAPGTQSSPATPAPEAPPSPQP